MSTSKKPKVESSKSFNPAENSSDEDDDNLYISIWDYKSTNKSSSDKTSTEPTPKSEPKMTSSTSGSGKSKTDTSIRGENGLVTRIQSRVSPRKFQSSNSGSCNNNILNSTANGNGQTSTVLDSDMHSKSTHNQNASCNSTNDLNNPSCSGLSTDVFQDSSNICNLDSSNPSTNNGDGNSASGVDSVMQVKSEHKNDPCNIPSDWDGPSCSGVNIRDMAGLSIERDLSFLRNMFPSVDEDVLKSYIEIYQDMEECLRVVSNLLYGGVEDDDIYINEEIKHTASESTRNTDQTISGSSTTETHQLKSPSRNHSDLPVKKESVDDYPGKKTCKDHEGRNESVAVKSERNIDNHDCMEKKAPLSSNNTEVASNIGSSSPLHTSRPCSGARKKQKPIFDENSFNVTLTGNEERESKDTKVHHMDTKPLPSHSLPSPTVQVGIDIRFGKNKAHPSMKRCLDMSLASRDIAQPYTRVKTSTNLCNSNVKCALDNSSDSSPSKRVCKDNSTHKSSSTCTNVDARSSLVRESTSSSRNSSVNNGTLSPLKRGQGQSKLNSPSNHPIVSARSSDSRGSPVTSRNSSSNPSSQSPSKRVQGQSSTTNYPSTSVNVTTSLDSRGSPSTSMNCSTNPGTQSPSKRMQGQSSTPNYPSTSVNVTTSHDSRESPLTSRNSSANRVSQSPSEKKLDYSLKHESSDNRSRTNSFTTSSTLRNSSEDSATNSSHSEQIGTGSQSFNLCSTDFSSFIDSVRKRMSESQGSLGLNQTAEMPTKRGKGPKCPTSFPGTHSLDTNAGMHIDWASVVRNMNDNQSPGATNTQPQMTTPITCTNEQSNVHQETPNNNNQTMQTAVVKQESQNQSNSTTFTSHSRSTTAYLNPEQIVLVVEKAKSNTNDCTGLPSESDVPHQEELSPEEEVARQEMLDLQRDTEMLTKVCPESDPNYIFSRLEELKDKPNRVAIVNKELIENATTTGGVENVIQRQKKVTWFWEDKKMRQIPFSKAESNIIESKYTKHNGSLVEVKFSATTLTLWFNFTSMTVIQTLRNKIRHIYRTESMEEILPGKDEKSEESGLSLPPLSNPETWHGHGGTNNTNTAMTRDLFEVLPGTSEFAHVDVLLKKSLPKAMIKKIKRVKNDWLERKYGVQRALLREKNGPGGINEMELFHGTRQTPPSVVWNSEEGFDMRYSADGMWGRGCYFAVHAAYSHHQFTHQYMHKQKRFYQIFLAHVLTGESIDMNPDRGIRKPPLNASTGRHYDSITGITQGHRIYVLYKNEASFPAYLITYTM